MSEYYRFPHHGLSFVESLSRYISGYDARALVLPEVYHDQGGALVVQINVEGSDSRQATALQTLVQVHHGQVTTPPSGDALTPQQLLALLPIRRADYTVQTERLMVRVTTRAQFERLRDELYTTNVVGLQDLVARAALLDDGVGDFPAIVFLDGLPTRGVYRWIEQYQVQAYHPYGVSLGLKDDADGWENRGRSGAQAVLHSYGGLGGQPTSGEQHTPNGVWIAAGRAKPYMSVLDAVLSHTPSGFDEQGATCVWLVEPDGRVTPVGAPFVALYFLHDFVLPEAVPEQTPALTSPIEPSELFRVDVRLRRAADPPEFDIEAVQRSLCQLERQAERIERQRRRLLGRRAELEREAHRDRVLQSASSVVALTPQGFTTQPKKLWLFFDRSITGYRQRLRWPALQELILGATLRELHQYRYAYCRFDLPATAKTPAETIGFHLLGYGDVREARSVETTPDGDRGPQAADLTLVQDPRWRRLGYNLYLPEGFEISPPLRPDDDRPDAVDDHQLFNALLAQAVFDLSSVSAPGSRFLEFKQTDNLCLLFEHPGTHMLVPVMLRREEFTPLIDASIAHLNQTGLTVPTHHDVGAVVENIERDLVVLVTGGGAAQAIKQAAKGLESVVNDLLDEGLRLRLDDLARQRDQKLEVLGSETAALENWLGTVEDRWQQIRTEVEARGHEVRRQSREAKRLLEDLTRGAAEMETISESGASNWEDFAARMAIVTAAARERMDASLQKAKTRLESAERTFATTADSVVGAARKTASELDARLNALVAQAGTGVGALARIETGITVIREQIAVLEGRRPTEDVEPSNVGTPISVGELHTLRQQVEQLARERDRLNQERDGALDAQDMVARLKGEIDALRGEGEHTRQLLAELGNELRRAQEQRDELTHQVEFLQGDAVNWQQRLQDVQVDLQERERTVAELQRALRGMAQKEAELHASLDELARLETALEQASRRIENLEHASRQAHERSVRRDQDSVGKWQAVIRGVLPILDDIRRANATGTVPTSPSSSAMIDGYRIIERKFDLFLDGQGVTVIPIVPGVTIFDPVAGHAAVGQVSREDLPDNVVVEVVRQGYCIGGRPLEDAQVIVNVRVARREPSVDGASE